MSNYKRLIDEAMKTASYRLNAGLDKTASVATESSLVKEASELANALEYMSMTTANDGSVVGQARAEMIRDFHKSASAQRLGVKLAGNVGEGPTQASGTQAQAPISGSHSLMAKKEVNGNPMVSASPDSTGKAMLESYKQANSGQTLYDILMHNKEAMDGAQRSALYAGAGGLVPILPTGTLGAALGADEGARGAAAGGAFAGGMAGRLAGMGIGLAMPNNMAAAGYLARRGLTAAGNAGGAYLGHRLAESDYEKEAGDVGEYTADQYMSIPSKNENSNRGILNDASILSGVKKSEAKAPVRDRLSEAFASTSDTLGDATVSKLFPQAYATGGLKKVAGVSAADRLKRMYRS